MRARRVAQKLAAGCTSSLDATSPQLPVIWSTRERGIGGRCSPAHIQFSDVGFSAETSGSGIGGVFSDMSKTYTSDSGEQYAPTMDISVTPEGLVAVLKWNERENRINLDSPSRDNATL